jgi:hypothetical protein
MKRLAILLCLAASSPTTSSAGSICIAKVPLATVGEKSLANYTASPVPFDFTMSFDDGRPVAASHSQSVMVSGLAYSAPHKVAIRQNGKPAASFVLRFKDYESDRLCLWYGPLYNSWSVWPMSRSRGKCTCRSAKL